MEPQHRASDTTLEFIVIVGFLVIVGGLAFKTLPTENRDLFSQGLGALIVIVTLVAKSLWERRGQAAEVTKQAIDGAQQALPPAATHLLLPGRKRVEDAVASGTEQGVKDAIADVVAMPQEAAIGMAIRDAIETGVLRDPPPSRARETEIIE